MADDIEGAHRVFTFISEGPCFGQIAQKRTESSGGAKEKRNRVLQVMFHRAPRLIDGDFPEILIISLSASHASAVNSVDIPRATSGFVSYNFFPQWSINPVSSCKSQTSHSAQTYSSVMIQPTVFGKKNNGN